MVCRRCGRKLRDPISIKIGYGPVCRSELGIEIEKALDKKHSDSASHYKSSEQVLNIPGQISMFDNSEWFKEVDYG